MHAAADPTICCFDANYLMHFINYVADMSEEYQENTFEYALSTPPPKKSQSAEEPTDHNPSFSSTADLGSHRYLVLDCTVPGTVAHQTIKLPELPRSSPHTYSCSTKYSQSQTPSHRCCYFYCLPSIPPR